MTAVAVALPVERDVQDTLIRNETEDRMRESRVLFFAGDDILSNEKHFNPELKGWGGTFMPHIRGLKQSINKGMLYRDKFTRITSVMQGEPTAMLHPNDRQNWKTEFSRTVVNPNGEAEQVTTKGFKQVRLQQPDEVENPHERQPTGYVNSPHMRYKERFPEHDVAQATYVDQPNGTRGVVEITALRNASLNEVHEAQLFFFPQWQDVQRGDATLPQTIRETEEHIQARMDKIAEAFPSSPEKQTKYRLIGQEMLRSCTEYRIGGQDYLKYVEDADREAKAKGRAFSYPEKATIFGQQLEIKRKDDLISGESSSVERLARAIESNGMGGNLEAQKLELELLRERNRARELELQSQTIAVDEKFDINEPTATTSNVIICGAPSAAGACQMRVGALGDKCRHHREKTEE